MKGAEALDLAIALVGELDKGIKGTVSVDSKVELMQIALNELRSLIPSGER